jgi:hypothetical protein
MLIVLTKQAPVPPPAYHRAQARPGPALHVDSLTLVRTLHLLTLCPLVVHLVHHRCPPPLPAEPGGAHLWRRLLAAPRTATHAVSIVVTGHA